MLNVVSSFYISIEAARTTLVFGVGSRRASASVQAIMGNVVLS